MTGTAAERPADAPALPAVPGGALPGLADRVRGALARALVRLPAPVLRALSGRPAVRRDGQTLDAALQFVLVARGRREERPLTAGSPAEARVRHRREILSVRGPTTAVGTVRDLAVDGAAGLLPARLYTPPRQPPAAPPLLVYFHGGGFVIGDLDTADEICRLLARYAGHAVLSVAYRLAPEHPFPAAIDDAEAAFRWSQAHAASLGADPSRVAVGGDSAGANLATVLAQRTAHDRPPAGQLLLYPPTDTTTAWPSHALFDGFFLSMADRNAFHAYYAAASNAPGADPRLSPLRATILAGLAPALVVTAGFDVLRDEGESYAAALLAAGTRCERYREPALGHGFAQLTGVCPAAHRAMVALARRWQAFVDRLPGTA